MHYFKRFVFSGACITNCTHIVGAEEVSPPKLKVEVVAGARALDTEPAPIAEVIGRLVAAGLLPKPANGEADVAAGTGAAPNVRDVIGAEAGTVVDGRLNKPTFGAIFDASVVDGLLGAKLN